MKKFKFINYIIVLLAFQFSSRVFSSELLNNKFINDSPKAIFDSHINEKLTLEDVILNQLFQEMKCNKWNGVLEASKKCMTKFPIKSDSIYLLKFRYGFTKNQKVGHESFQALGEQHKTKLVISEMNALIDDVLDLITSFCEPSMSSLSTLKIKNIVSEKFKFEITFFYDEGLGFIGKTNQINDLIIEKVETGIIAL